jgi:hypothetical protein
LSGFNVLLCPSGHGAYTRMWAYQNLTYNLVSARGKIEIKTIKIKLLHKKYMTIWTDSGPALSID